MRLLLAAAEPAIWGAVTWTDTSIVLLALVCAVFGFRSGFIWQVIRIGSMILAFWLATRYHGMVAQRVVSPLSEDTVNLLAFLAVFFAVLLVAYVLMFLARGPIDAIRPETIDHVLGFIFGFAKGLLICGILAMLVLRYVPADSAVHRQLSASKLACMTAWCVQRLSMLMTSM